MQVKNKGYRNESRTQAKEVFSGIVRCFYAIFKKVDDTGGTTQGFKKYRPSHSQFTVCRTPCALSLF